MHRARPTVRHLDILGATLIALALAACGSSSAGSQSASQLPEGSAGEPGPSVASAGPIGSSAAMPSAPASSPSAPASSDDGAIPAAGLEITSFDDEFPDNRDWGFAAGANFSGGVSISPAAEGYRVLVALLGIPPAG